MVLFPGMTSAAWDIHAKEYAAIPFQGPMSAPAALILSHANSALPFSKATTILDVGCGSGLVINGLASSYGTQIPSTARIIASDFSREMVNCCVEKKAELIGTEDDVGGIWGKCEIILLDASDLSVIGDGEVSHVTGSMVYFILPDPRKGLEAAYRVLHPGGVMSFTSFNKVEWIDIMSQAALRVRADAPSGFDPKKLGAWATTEGIKEELESVGFRDVKTEYHELNFPMTKPEMFVKGFMRSSNPGSKMIFREFSEEEMDRVSVEFLKLVEGRTQLDGIIIVATGTK